MSDGFQRVQNPQAVAAWERTHKTDEKTLVAVLQVGETHVVTAVDVDTTNDVLASETVGSAHTPAEAVQIAQTWINEHPKGIKGDGALASLLG